ncbi:unnamed protein product [Chrysoparadoxa australica]
MIAQSPGTASFLVGSFGLKAPQLALIYKEKSTLGLSAMAQYFDALCVSAIAIYHVLRKYPLTSYGEYSVLSVQNVAVVVMMWIYGHHSTAEIVAASTIFFGLAAGALALPEKHQPILIFLSQPMTILIALPQIWLNFKQGHTGTMSALTAFLKLGGSVTRVFTSFVELDGDIALLINYALSVVANATLLLQWWFWRDKTNAALHGGGKGKGKK